jgi:hypothetical protein
MSVREGRNIVKCVGGLNQGNEETTEAGEIVIGHSLESYISKNLKPYNIRLFSFSGRLCDVSKPTPRCSDSESNNHTFAKERHRYHTAVEVSSMLVGRIFKRRRNFLKETLE